MGYRGGASIQAMSQTLYLSVRTVNSHLSHIYAKLGVSSRTAVAAYVFHNGLS